MVPRFTDATIAVAVRGLRGAIAAAECAAASIAGMTWRARAMPAALTPVNALMIVMIEAPSSRPLGCDLEAKRSRR